MVRGREAGSRAMTLANAIRFNEERVTDREGRAVVARALNGLKG